MRLELVTLTPKLGKFLLSNNYCFARDSLAREWIEAGEISKAIFAESNRGTFLGWTGVKISKDDTYLDYDGLYILVYIRPRYRHKGIGRYLLDAMTFYCRMQEKWKEFSIYYFNRKKDWKETLIYDPRKKFVDGIY